MEDYSKKLNNITINKSIRFPKDLAERIEKDAKEQDRDFTKQIIYMTKKYYEIKGNL